MRLWDGIVRLFPRGVGAKAARLPLRLYNTLSQELEEFTLHSVASSVRMYNCGPTVYDTSHIGNLRSYIFADTLRRVLEYNGFSVKQVINITDFGHLSSDADRGEDKMTKALKKRRWSLTLANMRKLADEYTQQFIEDLNTLNVETDKIQFPRASDHIAGEIALIKTLEEKSYTYAGADGLYFDTSRFPTYGALGNIDIEGLRAGARVVAAADKRLPTDFLLWKSDAKLGWESPWGRGFPGWHIECSAMINATLGKQIDIHTGGIDLLPTHHNNEIAQSESATGKRPFSRFWMHHEFLNLSGEKISKSLGNTINLETLKKKGFHPLSLRYMYLAAHYRTALTFTWEALEAAQTAYLRLVALRLRLETEVIAAPKDWQRAFHERINDDLDTPLALAHLWEGIAAGEPADSLAMLNEADRVFGLHLMQPDEQARSLAAAAVRAYVALSDISAETVEILEKREQARRRKDWTESDARRDELAVLWYGVDDTSDGQKLYKK